MALQCLPLSIFVQANNLFVTVFTNDIFLNNLFASSFSTQYVQTVSLAHYVGSYQLAPHVVFRLRVYNVLQQVYRCSVVEPSPVIFCFLKCFLCFTHQKQKFIVGLYCLWAIHCSFSPFSIVPLFSVIRSKLQSRLHQYQYFVFCMGRLCPRRSLQSIPWQRWALERETLAAANAKW